MDDPVDVVDAVGHTHTCEREAIEQHIATATASRAPIPFSAMRRPIVTLMGVALQEPIVLTPNARVKQVIIDFLAEDPVLHATFTAAERARLTPPLTTAGIAQEVRNILEARRVAQRDLLFKNVKRRKKRKSQPATQAALTPPHHGVAGPSAATSVINFGAIGALRLRNQRSGQGRAPHPAHTVPQDLISRFPPGSRSTHNGGAHPPWPMSVNIDRQSQTYDAEDVARWLAQQEPSASPGATVPDADERDGGSAGTNSSLVLLGPLLETDQQLHDIVHRVQRETQASNLMYLWMQEQMQMEAHAQTLAHNLRQAREQSPWPRPGSNPPR